MLFRFLNYPSLPLFNKPFSKPKTILIHIYYNKFRFLSSTSLSLSSSSETHFTKPSNFSTFHLNTFKVLQKLYLYRNNPSLAFSYFTLLNQHGFCHNIQTYVAIIKILCYWKLDTRLDSLLCDVVYFSKQNPLFQIHELFESLFEGVVDVQNKNHDLIRVFDLFVKAYVGLNMFDDAVEFLFQIQIKRFRIFPSIVACNFLISRLVEYDRVDMALVVYDEIIKKLLCPNRDTYAIIIKALCKNVLHVFNEMKEAGVTPDSECYASYIEGLCNHHMSNFGYDVLQEFRKSNGPIEGYACVVVIHAFCKELKLDKAERVFNYMGLQGFVPDFHVYSWLIRGYCKHNDLNKALALHKNMISKGIKTNCVIVSCILHCSSEMGKHSKVVDVFNELKRSGVLLDRVAYNIVFNSLCKLGKMDEAVGMLEELKSMHINLDITHYTAFINGYCLQGKPEKAYNKFKEMEEKGFKPDVVVYNVLVNSLFRNRCECEAIDLLFSVESQSVKPNSTTHKIIIEGLCSVGKVEVAEAYFNGLKHESVEIEIYSGMVNGYCEASLFEKAYELFFEILNQIDISKESLSFKLIGEVMYSKVLIALCKARNMERARSLFDFFPEIGFTPNLITYTIMIEGYCGMNNFQKAYDLFQYMKSVGFKPDIITYTIMIKCYCRMNNLHKAYDLFQDMKSRGIKPDVIIYTVLLDWRIKLSYSSQNTKGKAEPYNVSTILKDMEEMGISRDVFTYTVLIDGYIKLNKFEDAIRLFDEIIDRELEPDTAAYTALICGLLNGGHTKDAVAYYNEMSSKGMELPSNIFSQLKSQIMKVGKGAISKEV